MKKLVIIVLSLIALHCFSFAQKFVSVNGKDIIDQEGKPLLLKGINVGNWLVPEGYMFKFKTANSPHLINELLSEMIGPSDAGTFWNRFLNTYITYDDVKFIKSLGFNHIRLPFNYRMLVDETYLGKTNHGYKYLDSMVNWCKRENMLVLLDMHCAPGGQTGDNIDDSYGYPFIYESLADQNQFVDVWKSIATRYKNNETVLGYELMNEPIADFLSNKDSLNTKLEKLYKKATYAIRVIDTNHLIFLGGAQWNNNFGVFGEPFDKKLVYTFHKYWMPVKIEEIQTYIDFRNKYNVPIYLGESGENTNDWIASFRTLLDENNIGWSFWTYKKMDDERCVITFPKPNGYEQVIYFAESDRFSYERIRSHRPDISLMRYVISGFLEKSKFSNCIPNKNYVKALGLDVK